MLRRVGSVPARVSTSFPRVGSRFCATSLRDVFARRFRATLLASTSLTLACELLPHPGDTAGEQRVARWEWHGRLVMEDDSTLTLTRLRIDTAGVMERRDVLLTRFEFDPTGEPGDEYWLTLGLDLGTAGDLPLNEPLAIGAPPAPVRAAGTVVGLGTPLRPDSVRGRFLLSQRGLRQLTGRIEATLFFTAWHDTSAHATYELRQKIYGVK